MHDHLTATYPAERGVFWAGAIWRSSRAPEVNIREGAHVIVIGEVPSCGGWIESFPRRLSEAVRADAFASSST